MYKYLNIRFFQWIKINIRVKRLAISLSGEGFLRIV